MTYLEEFKEKDKWIKEKVDKETVDFAKRFAKYLVESYEGDKELSVPGIFELKANQLRKFFGAVKNFQLRALLSDEFNESEFIMLKPKLAYAVGRVKQQHKNDDIRIKDFADVISKAIDFVIESKDKERSFKNFVNFFEAIVAYHKQEENNITK